VMEGAAYLLKQERDPDLEQRMDEIVDIIAGAQQDDGYLYEAHITGVSKNYPHWGPAGMGDRPYSWEVQSHELYNMGHMYEAAIAYYQATKKNRWLQVAEKSAQHINRVFFIGGDANYNDGKPVNQAPGHQEIELALAKLYRVTGNRLHLDMAKRFLDIRGVTYVPHGDEPEMQPEYAQQHKPVAQQEEVAGHAVRALYMYSAMAEVEALTNRRDYAHALQSVWHNMVDTRMHITGGLGAIAGHEGFGPPYELPNKNTYNETCAAVANVLFNFRMFLLTRNAQFMDVAEVALFNNALAGMNLAGNAFFYVNPLEADGQTPFNGGKPGRSPWFSTACCPTNLARLIPQVPGLMYSHDNETIYISLYAGSSTSVRLEGGVVHIAQQTAYPFEGRVTLTLQPQRRQTFKLALRIPTWAGSDQFVPGALYDYVAPTSTSWTIAVNAVATTPVIDGGFAILERTWSPGDTVSLSLPLPVRFNRAIPAVQADRDRVAITRGPLVYCAEGADNTEPVQRFFLQPLPESNATNITTYSDGVLQGIVKIELPAKRISSTGIENQTLTLIPYYAWNNRGDNSMTVWLPSDEHVVSAAQIGLFSGERSTI
jgi:uncharacterized protein